MRENALPPSNLAYEAALGDIVGIGGLPAAAHACFNIQDVVTCSPHCPGDGHGHEPLLDRCRARSCWHRRPLERSAGAGPSVTPRNGYPNMALLAWDVLTAQQV